MCFTTVIVVDELGDKKQPRSGPINLSGTIGTSNLQRTTTK